MSEVQLPPDEEVVSVCLAEVVRKPRPFFASVGAMAEAATAEWDLLALSCDKDSDEDDDCPPCELCGHPFSQKHRVVLGSWGGTYHPSNVVRLCPNHHAMIHVRVKHHQDADSLTNTEWVHLEAAMHDPGINQLWASRAKAASIQRCIDLGIY